MNINNSINQYNNFASSSSVGNTSTQSLTGNTVSSLKEGAVFEGSINSIDSNGRVTIGLANGQTMSARLDSGVSITQGQSLFFQVKSNDGMLVQIRPVSLDITNNPTLLKALDSANIMATEKTISMVNAMMERSMPIDAESLASMNRTMINNPTVDFDTIILMNKYGIPVSEENARMFENYAKNEAAIMKDVSALSSNITAVLSSEELPYEQTAYLSNKLGEILLSENTFENVSTAHTESELIQESVFDNTIYNSVQTSVADGDTLISNTSVKDDALLNVSTETEEQPVIVDNVNLENVSDKVNLSANGQNAINKLIADQPGLAKELGNLIYDKGQLNPEATNKDIYLAINRFINGEGATKARLNSVFKNDGVKELIDSLIKDNFSIKPEDITKPKALSNLYEKILKQTNDIQQAFANVSGKAAENIKQATVQLKDNISFMNSSNDLYTFVQIPLKMFDQNTESALYVRQNKKGAYKEGDELTAFLHFDMEHLGSTDVYIRLKEKNVNCNWNLANEKSLELIENNIDILTERLAKKGFSCNNEVSCQKTKNNFVNDFLGENTTGDNLLHRYSFDMRA